MTYKLNQKIDLGDDGIQIYTGFVTPLPGNPDIAISHGVFRLVGDGGAGKQANNLRVNQIAEDGYSAVMCTVCSSNFKQIKILTDTGWSKIFEFTSYRTTHKVFVFAKEILHIT